MIHFTNATGSQNYNIAGQGNLSGVQTDLAKVALLCKYTNDMTAAITYAYSVTAPTLLTPRYLNIAHIFTSVKQTMPSVSVQTFEAGYYKFEVYEVTWVDAANIATGYAPVSETDVLSPAADDKGVVQGLITKGKMLISATSGTEEVQYTEHPEPSGTNYIYYGS